MNKKNLSHLVPKLTLGTVLLGLALSLVLPARAVDLLERYPTTLEKGLLGGTSARPCTFTTNDIFQLSRFRLAVGDQLKVETGPATLGIGHTSVGATWAVIIPAEDGKLTRQGNDTPEPIAHIWLRFHPSELNRLFPVSTVSEGASDLSSQIRRVAAGKFGSSYHAGNRAMIPEPKDMTVDVDTKGGPRRFFVVDTAAKKAEYAAAFESQPVRISTTVEAVPAPQGPPKVVATTPANGATDVDAGLKEITVTFDQDMNPGGYSWTGGPPEFPPAAQGAKPSWRGARTCVLPVQLEAGRHYRVGINGPSFKNFKSAEGVPAQVSEIRFSTK